MNMRKLLTLLMIAGMVTLFACGTCNKEDHDHDHDKDKDKQEEVKAKEQVAADTIAITEEQQVAEDADSTAKVE